MNGLRQLASLAFHMELQDPISNLVLLNRREASLPVIPYPNGVLSCSFLC